MELLLMHSTTQVKWEAQAASDRDLAVPKTEGEATMPSKTIKCS